MFLLDTGQICDVVLSARGTSRDNELIQYIQEKLLPYPFNNINPLVFQKISAKTASTWDMLQLADVCATTMFSAYEVNRFGFNQPCFSYMMLNHLYKRFGKIDDYGVKFFSRVMIPSLEEIHSRRVCSLFKKIRTPGATAT